MGLCHVFYWAKLDNPYLGNDRRRPLSIDFFSSVVRVCGRESENKTHGHYCDGEREESPPPPPPGEDIHTSIFSPLMTTSRVTTFVKDRHGFISRSYLKLHKISLGMFTFRTCHYFMIITSRIGITMDLYENK
jgi:hypothetical protein